MRKILLLACLICMVINVTGQDDELRQFDFSELSNDELITKISSFESEISKKVYLEIFSRGESVISALMKVKGNKSIANPDGLGYGNLPFGIVSPVEEASKKEIAKGVKKGVFITNEVVALYLITAIYENNLDFAQAPYLTDKNYSGDRRFNTPKRTRRAWNSTKKWYKRLQIEGLDTLRKKKFFPLMFTKVTFYRTDVKIRDDY